MSIDSMFVHKMWDDHELSKMVDGGVPFPMLSDAGERVGAAYGVYDEEAGVETRGRFIIDPDGVVQGFEVLTPRWAATWANPCARSRRSSTSGRVKARKPRPRAGVRANSPSSPDLIWWARCGRSGRRIWPSTDRLLRNMTVQEAAGVDSAASCRYPVNFAV